MKIRPGQLSGSKPTGPAGGVGSTDGRFQVLLDQELQDVTEKQPDLASHDEDAAQRSYQLINDATRLLDDAITQIETSDTPQEKTIASLHQLRNELAGLGQGDASLSEAKIILSVEAERLESW